MYYKFLLLSISLFMLGCTKSINDGQRIEYKFESYSISNQEQFDYSFGNIPVEGDISIIEQAKTFEASQLVLDTVKGGWKYFYIPKKDYIGKDLVKIKLTSSSGGSRFLTTIYELEFIIN